MTKQKGDILVRNADDYDVNLPVGGNGYVLTADSTTDSGVDWKINSGATYFSTSQSSSYGDQSILTPDSGTNTGIVLATLGTGILSRNTPDGTASGGNTRGGFSVDLQSDRSAATEVASGLKSTISGGVNNTASGDFTVVSGGSDNTASGLNSTISGGITNTASGDYSTVSGANNTASANSSIAMGKRAVSNVIGQSSHASGRFANDGDAQSSHYVLRGYASSGSSVVLTTDGGAASTDNQIILTSQQCISFHGTIIAKREGSANSAAWEVKGMVYRTTTPPNTSVLGISVTTIANSPVWSDPTITADTTNGGISITFTDTSAYNQRVVAEITTAEVTYA